jgi:hypothetical protein
MTVEVAGRALLRVLIGVLRHNKERKNEAIAVPLRRLGGSCGNDSHCPGTLYLLVVTVGAGNYSCGRNAARDVGIPVDINDSCVLAALRK